MMKNIFIFVALVLLAAASLSAQKGWSAPMVQAMESLDTAIFQGQDFFPAKPAMAWEKDNRIFLLSGQFFNDGLTNSAYVLFADGTYVSFEAMNNPFVNNDRWIMCKHNRQLAELPKPELLEIAAQTYRGRPIGHTGTWGYADTIKPGMLWLLRDPHPGSRFKTKYLDLSSDKESYLDGKRKLDQG